MTSQRLLTSLLLLLACAGCESEPSTPNGAPRVAFLLSTLQEERYKKDQQYFEQTAAQHGLNVTTLSADNDNAMQLAQVEDALERGAQVLVIQPTDSDAAARYVARAHDQGAAVVAYDRSIPGADTYVAHDSYSIGCMQAEAALDATGGKGNFILLNGQAGHSVAQQIRMGYEDTLRPFTRSGDVKIVLDESHDKWSPEQAAKTVGEAIELTGGRIDAILAHNSGLARGALQAVQAAGLTEGKVFIAGADADAANVNYVCQQKQSVEVLKDVRPLAERAAKVAADLAVSPEAYAPVEIVPVVLVTPDNVGNTLIESGFHERDALPACATGI